MKKTLAIVATLCAWCLTNNVQAGEKTMQQALAHWQQQMLEYQAAVSLATTDEKRAALEPPSADEFAPVLWSAVCRETGKAPMPPTDKQAQSAEKRMRPIYEFESEWAAPAVIWFINNPDAFAKLFENNPKRLSYFAKALLYAMKHVHFAHPQAGEACHKLAESTSSDVFEIVEKIYNKNTSPAARSCAALALSCMLAEPALSAAEGGAARARSKRLYYIKQALSLAPEDTKFGAVSLTDAATEEIYRLQNLAPGRVPPQLHLTTPAGKAATFPVQGKVNLLFFWSPEEDMGLSIMSKQAALQKRYPELELCPIVPFADMEPWQSFLQQHKITTCYMDNAKGDAGIAYRVSRLPLAVLISDQSRIIYIGYPNLQLQTELDNLFSGKQNSPTPQPTQPKQAAPQAPQPPARNDTPPELRPMPEF